MKAPRPGPPPSGLDASAKEISLTFAKGLDVICAFDKDDWQMTLSDIAEKVGYNRSVTRRIVRTLEMLGYVQCNRRLYSLTPRILRLSQGFLEGRQVGRLLYPILGRASDSIGESVSLAMLDGEEAVYVAHSQTDARLITTGFTVGSRLPLLPTGLGRAMLAFLPRDEGRRLVETLPLKKYTEATCTDREELMAQLAEVRTKGYALVDGEFEEGIVSLAAPVLREGNQVLGAVGLAAPSPRLKGARVEEEIVPALRECARTLAQVM